ncbi:hypothetical protein [Spirulina sp. 06S082]|uniref:hypothetical protein n=1 Tax=Spirulina sp. 06S082 TaxID=3110248 RepID=UPI002B1EF06E|nr:hypothetical protein [Spirulina sp. 06S082]MEA5469407.1 hypothetical protein [Spirulina sp. 06S082]
MTAGLPLCDRFLSLLRLLINLSQQTMRRTSIAIFDFSPNCDRISSKPGAIALKL